jgi:non-haem dioxygenase in morphine synthesis N-terminal
MLPSRIPRLVQSTTFKTRLFATVAQDNKAFGIPVIDFSKFREATAPSEKKPTARSVVSAFKQSGFVYLSGHGIPSSMLFLILCQRKVTLLQALFRLPSGRYSFPGSLSIVV